MSIRGSNVNFHSGHTVGNRATEHSALLSRPAHGFGVTGRLNRKMEDEEHNLELELHRFLSQHSSNGSGQGDESLNGAGAPHNATGELSGGLGHRDEMAEAIEKAMAEIACPELWSHENSGNEMSTENEVQLSQLTMDGILGDAEPFATLQDTDGSVRRDVPSVVQQPLVGTTFESNTPTTSEHTTDEHTPSGAPTPTGKRKYPGSGVKASSMSKRAKLFYETISPESLSPLSDNNDFLKGSYGKATAGQPTAPTTASEQDETACANAKIKTQASVEIALNNTASFPKSRLIPQMSMNTIPQRLAPEKLTKEFTLQQVTETKRRIINTHKLILNFNFLKDSYTRSCSELKRAMFKLKESECHRARLVKENEQLKRLALELNSRLECTKTSETMP